MSSASIKVVVDRIEGQLAVVVVFDDDRIKVNFPLALLPEGTREGDHLLVSFTKDDRSRDSQRERIASLLEELRAKNK